jgi:hypothetical protein
MHLSGSRSSSTAYVRVVVCCCGLLMLAGCSSNTDPRLDKLVSVKGKVTLNGTPLPDGRVSFYLLDRDPNTPFPVPSGKIEADGSYKLDTQGRTGAPLGKYRAAVDRGEDRKAWNQVDPIYLNRNKSPLEIEVTENKPEGAYDLNLLPRKASRR